MKLTNRDNIQYTKFLNKNSGEIRVKKFTRIKNENS